MQIESDLVCSLSCYVNLLEEGRRGAERGAVEQGISEAALCLACVFKIDTKFERGLRQAGNCNCNCN